MVLISRPIDVSPDGRFVQQAADLFYEELMQPLDPQGASREDVLAEMRRSPTVEHHGLFVGDADRLVAVGAVDLAAIGHGVAHLTKLAVHHDERRKGYGRTVVTLLESAAILGLSRATSLGSLAIYAEVAPLKDEEERYPAWELLRSLRYEQDPARWPFGMRKQLLPSATQ